MVEFDERILKPRTNVHCKTKKEIINLLTWAHSKGLKWRGGDSFIPIKVDNLQGYGDDTVYDIYKGQYTDIKLALLHKETVLSYREAVINDISWLT